MLQHAQNLRFGLVICHPGHCHKFDPSLIILALFEVLSLTLIHYEDNPVVHGRELFIRETRWIHFEFCLADMCFIL